MLEAYLPSFLRLSGFNDTFCLVVSVSVSWSSTVEHNELIEFPQHMNGSNPTWICFNNSTPTKTDIHKLTATPIFLMNIG